MDSDSESSVSNHEKEMQDLNKLAALNNCSLVIDCSSITITPASRNLFSLSALQLQELAKIESALILNNSLNEKYKTLEKVLTQRLRECRDKLRKNSDIANNPNIPNGYRFGNCGKPYFKDDFHFSAPDNKDTILMKKSGICDFSSCFHVASWTVREKSRLSNILLQMSKDIRKEKLSSEIASYKREGSKSAKKKIADLKKQIKSLKKKTLADLALPIDEEYDWETVAIKLSKRHSPLEYRNIWKLFLHPAINKSHWSRREHQDIQRIAKEHNMQDWDTIARELNTGRTSYQCFVYFRTNNAHAFYGQKWTSEEVEYLKRIIDYYRQSDYIPWSKVASAIENRTKAQVYNKYIKLSEKRKGRFFPEEDSVILSYFKVYGENFKDMSQYIPGRSPVQLRRRYQILTKMSLSKMWTVEEDKKLLKIMANCDSPNNYSMATKHFPGKDRNNIRSRYCTLMKWMKSHPLASDISRAPRRDVRRLFRGKVVKNLETAVENLKKRMQKEVKKKKVTKKTARIYISKTDKAIMRLLFEDTTKTDCNQANEVLKQNENFANLRNLLILLKTSLDKDKIRKEKISLYENFDDMKNEFINIKCHSMQETVKPVPNVWGENMLEGSQYVLPPNYDTITASKMLLKHFTSENFQEKLNNETFQNMLKNNDVLKNQLETLQHRFTTLFLWSILLSNLPATPQSISPQINVSKEGVRQINSTNNEQETTENIDVDSTTVKEFDVT